MFEYIKESIVNIVKSRIFVLVIAFILLFGILIQRLFYLQVISGEEYSTKVSLQIEKTRELSATRGNIYDRNGTLLAYSELAYSVTIEDTFEAPSGTGKTKNDVMNETIFSLITLIEECGDSIDMEYGIVLDENNTFQYTTDAGTTSRYRFLADVYGKSAISELSDEQKNITAEELVKYLCETSKGAFGILSETYTKEQQLKILVIRYGLWLNRYSKYTPTKVATAINDNTRAAIMENLSELEGVEVIEDSVRKYNSSVYMASIIGYTGSISQEEYDGFVSEGYEDLYTLQDTVGKTGLERELDTYLQGEKGSETVYVDSLGKVLETKERTDPSAGNDVHLTIDADLQEVTYNIIEQKLAGILVEKITPAASYNARTNSDIRIPINDVYYALFNNQIISVTAMAEERAGETEQAVYQAFLNKQGSVLQELRNQLHGEAPPAYAASSEEYQIYFSYITDQLLSKNTGVLLTDKIDTSDEIYIAWKNDESISLKDYLNYAISMDWIDTSKLEVEGKYSSASETYEALVNYIINELQNDAKFSKRMFKYMIRDGMISGTQVCLVLFEQGVLEYNEGDINGLRSGSLSSYTFMINQISALNITPAQLALQPCTGSAVVTDVNTGEVLAAVSYPSYDNNRLANTMDVEYYNKLYDDLSEPFFNYATQEVTAPGSTFKMVSSAAGLEEGVVSLGELINCEGVYSLGETKYKCWISPGRHGQLDVVGALRESCNYYFYEVGYRLSGGASGYDAEAGLAKLANYASMFGLNDPTGIEMTESTPRVSDEYPVPSAIGQGTNAFSTAQLSRYGAAIANTGTCYNLTLLDKVTDIDGNVVEDFSAEVRNQIELSATTWNAIQTGMREVIQKTASFNELTDVIEVAGKTGTAQQSKTRPDHGLFVGYAPYSNPEISVATRITNGYTSGNALDIGKDIIKYYFDISSKEEIVTGHAAGASANISD